MSSDKKKVLIISYYWPPSGGSGVQRWLKFVKYLPQFDIHPYVFTPRNPSFALRDESLLKDVPPEVEVIEFPIWEPYHLFQKVSKENSSQGSVADPVHGTSFKQRMGRWIRANIIIPDPRVFWVKPSSSFLESFIQEHRIRTIITTGPPHSIHLIGLRLKKKVPGVQWIADFRDPWSEWGFLDTLGVGKLARWIHKTLEARVLKKADKVITITPFYKRHFERLGQRKVQLINNGYDDADFQSLQIAPTEKFVIRHVGIVHDLCNPRPFLNAVKNLCIENESFKDVVEVNFTGSVNATFFNDVKSDPLLSQIVTFQPSVPHRELISLYGQSSVLLLVLYGYRDAEGYMPGKLYEYIATGLPIIAVGPEGGDAAHLLTEIGAGTMVDGTEERKIQECIAKEYNQWKLGTNSVSSHAGGKYSRKNLTAELAKLL
jgi:glycosyltransferase involved in cell wall biosynthesis